MRPLFLAVVLFRLNQSGRVGLPHHTLVMNIGFGDKITYMLCDLRYKFINLSESHSICIIETTVYAP